MRPLLNDGAAEVPPSMLGMGIDLERVK